VTDRLLRRETGRATLCQFNVLSALLELDDQEVRVETFVMDMQMQLRLAKVPLQLDQVVRRAVVGRTRQMHLIAFAASPGLLGSTRLDGNGSASSVVQPNTDTADLDV
jgi:hypothetical protein